MRKITILLTFLFLAGMQFAFGQAGTISGKVTSSEDGQGIPGVTIQVKGTTVGTTTDINGDYSLTKKPNYEVLVFSYVGMKTVEITIGDQTVINVVLEPSAQMMQEVVVTALGITRERKALGYSVQEVQGDALTYQNNADVVNSLAARTAGVQVTSSGGTAGASSFITIRGYASISGNNQPLFVVDGQPINTDMGWSGMTYQTEGVNASSRSIDLNPDDIESVSVLKGGAATALYGVQAANGVILITTKQGKMAKTAEGKKKLNINFNYSLGIDKISHTQKLQNTYGQGQNGDWVSGNAYAWGPKLDTSSYSTDESVWTYPEYDVDGAIVSQNDPTANGQKVKTYSPYDFFQTGYTHNTNLSVSGADEKSSVYLSIGNLNQEGIIPDNTLKRTSVRVNAETKLADWLTVGGHANYINTDANLIENGSNVSGIMLGLLRTPPTFDNGAGWIFEDGTQRTYRHGGGYNNPYWSVNENYFHDKVNRFIGDAYFKVNFTKDLNLSYTLGIDWFNRRYTEYFAVNDRTYGDGRMQESGDQSQIINSNLLLNYNKMFNDKFTLNVTLGQNLYQNKDDETRALANDLGIPGFQHVENTSTPTLRSIRTNWRTSAFFGDLRFDLFNQLYLGATARYESATTMPSKNRSSLYPSFNLGWVFSELIPENDVLSFGKLRASWAKTANIAGPYYTQTYFNKLFILDGWVNDGISFPFHGLSAYEVGYLIGNSDLKHETMKTFEVGTELKFFNNRLGLDVAYFNNKNSDLLLEVPVATSSGYNNSYMNAASMESKGWEITVNATPITTNHFNWDILINWSKINNKVTDLAPGVPNVFLGGFTDPQIRAVAGMDYGTIYGYDWWRAADGTVLINDNPDDQYPDGFPWTCDTAQVPIGSVLPDWTMNISNTFTLYGFSLYTLFDIKYGGKMYNGTRFALNNFGMTEETLNRDVVYNDDGSINYDLTPKENIVVYEGYPGHFDANGNLVWTETPNTTQVVNDQTWYQGNGSNFGGGPTTSAIESTSWIRLREVTLSYRFNESLLKKSGFIYGLELFFTGKNLWLNTPYTGIDPETNLTGARNSQGMDYFNNPGTKSYIFGIRASF